MLDWRNLGKRGFLTLSIVAAAAVVVGMAIPALDLRGALMLIALVALLLGWVL